MAGIGILIGVGLALVIWITPSILISRVHTLPGRVRAMWALGSLGSVSSQTY